MSPYHLGNFPFKIINSQFINLLFHQLAISLNHLFVKLTFHQLTILSTCHFANQLKQSNLIHHNQVKCFHFSLKKPAPFLLLNTHLLLKNCSLAKCQVDGMTRLQQKMFLSPATPLKESLWRHWKCLPSCARFKGFLPWCEVF